MLSKKILLLKKKIEKYKKIAETFNSLVDDNENLKSVIKCLENKVKSQQSSITSLQKNSKAVLKAIDLLEDSKETCSKDLSILAGAITEIYTAVSFAIDGDNLYNDQASMLDTDFYQDEYSVSELDNDNAFDDKKKKKKIYH
tara:strand:- start:715 stop:1140 length:426 start_codon:yes stop_codon:yes gene_type:complete